MREMATYRELLAQVKDEIDEVGAAEARERHGEAVFVDVRERDEWEEGAVPGAVHIPRGNLESRIEGLVPDRTDGARPLLRRRLPLRVRREGARRARLRERHLPDRRLHRLEAQRLPGRDAEQPHAGPAPPLLAAPADPGGRRGRPGAAAQLARAADRRRRAGLARVALPRRRRRRHARHRRCGRRRRLEPAAPDRPLDRPARRGRRCSPRSGRSRRSTRTSR